jgi:hypothetical protein
MLSIASSRTKASSCSRFRTKRPPRSHRLSTKRKISYPVLLDSGRKLNDLFVVEGIPKSLLYDRNEKMVAQSIDMRTRTQFVEMLAPAGLQ